MVTRVYCDHCGNAAPNAKMFIFGAHSYYFGISDPQHVHNLQQQNYAAATQQTALGVLAGGQKASNPPIHPSTYNPPEIIRAGSVDLCDHCQVVWMNRVKALTQASEP